jgi:hypothetical protein
MLPPDDRLEQLARGTLHLEDIDSVAERVEADPTLAARFADVVASDPLTAALATTPPNRVPVETLERVWSGVLQILSAASDTPTRTDPADSTPVPDSFARRSNFPPPTWLGGYRIRRELGRGGMGVVYEAQDEALGRLVAIKTLKPALATAQRARERFLREARALAAVVHPNVVPIHHVGEEVPSAKPEGFDGIPYVVMPLLHGETLQARLDRKGRLPADEVIQIGRDVASGLEAAHARALIHRDLKPANIWLDADSGRAVVLDFGLAVPSDGSVPADPSSGTPTYMSPEQARGAPLDHRADLFALGAVLYRATTGRPAFGGSTRSTVLTAVTEHHPDPPSAVNPSVPPRLSALILRLLAKAPSDRPATAQHVVAELDRMGGPTPNPTRRRKLVIGVVLLTLLAGVAGGIWAVARAPDAPVDGGTGTNDPPVAPTPKDQPGPRPVVVPVKYRGSVDLCVYRKNDKNADELLPLWEPRAMPLCPGDEVMPVAKVDPPGYLYLFWISETGEGVPLYPWRVKDWKSRPANEEPVAEVKVKWPDGEALAIDGVNAGTETVLMLARPTKLELPDDQVQKWFTGLRPVPFRGDKTCVWFENFDVLRDDPNRRAPGKGGELEGPRALQLVLKQRIGSAAEFSWSVSFSRRGAK